MRYFFDIFDDDHWTRDDRGIECRDDRDARHQAVLALTEMARDQLPNNGPKLDLKVAVRLAEQHAFTVRLDFDIEPGPALVDRTIAS